MIPALVLTAGLGTRLQPLSFVRAKGALPLGNEPLARRILRWLGHAGVRDVVLNLHHLPHTLTRAIGDGSDIGLRVRYSWETPVLGSAGGPRRALPLLSDRGADLVRSASSVDDSRASFLIVNGDTLTDVDLAALVADHDSSGALVTMAVIPNTEPGKYSGVAADAEGRFTGFVPRGSPEPSFHFIGVQAARPGAFAAVPAGTPYEVGALYAALAAAQPGSIRLFRTKADFLDIGTPADYLNTALTLADRDGLPCAGVNSRVDFSASVERSVLWDDVVVHAGAMLNECVVTDGVVVPADTSWHGVTLRVPTEERAAGERVIDGLAVCSL
ncbi:MAG TPA: sugar phosphate nucleotidyltransferase [Vicinamibacterales bacterium]|nr:sugar phosphate nucleotidyltransferase [Vicinamibacterales bacterium]